MTSAVPDILVVEDEYLIRVLLEEMLFELGFTVVVTAGSISEAKREVETRRISAAILDVNVAGEEIFPVADMLVERGLPFMFVTGYAKASLPERFRDRPTLQKPFQAERLKMTLNGLRSPSVPAPPVGSL